MIEQSRFFRAACPSDRPRIADLTAPERLLVWAFRSWAFAHQAVRSVERDFCRSCGREEGERAAVAVRSILVLVALYGRRTLGLGPPGWPAATVDEIRMLQLFAAAQHGGDAAVAAHLAWLLRADHSARPEAAIGEAAAIMARSGLVLPWRYLDGPAPPARPAPARAYAEALRPCE